MHLGDGLFDVEKRDHGRADVAGRNGLELGGPVVDGPGSGGDDLGGADAVGPDPDGRIGGLGPHAFLVEILQPQVRVVGPRGPVADRAVQVADGHVGHLGHPAAELLAVHVDRLPGAVRDP